MPPLIATALFAIGIAGLFYLDRDSERPSKALWLTVIWLSINGSRSLSVWLQMGPAPREMAGQMPETSLLDQLIAGTLMLWGAIVLIRRKRQVRVLLKANWPILLFFSVAPITLLWSDFPAWGFKRWIRSLGDLIMVLIVVTDAQPIAALKRLFSRVGFVLLPASVLLIRYYPELGTTADVWGDRGYAGVTTNKNLLGNLTFVLALGALWQTLDLICDKKRRNRTRRLLAQCTLFAFGIQLLFTAHCATAGACFILGVGLVLATALPGIRHRPPAVHALVLLIFLTGALTELLGDRGAITGAMGRDAGLTGRTEIWGVVIPMVNPLGGAGFETFWLGPRVQRIFAIVQGGRGLAPANEAHNGYIEVYLNLGCLGLGLLALILWHGYAASVSAFRRDWALGALLLAYVVTAMFYNITEAGFRILTVEWFFLLLSIMVANRVILAGKRTRRSHVSLNQASWQRESPSLVRDHGPGGLIIGR